MPSFTLPDPYEGWTADQLRDRVRELSGALMERDLMIANMVEQAPCCVFGLDEPLRTKARNLRDAWDDGDSTSPATKEEA